MPARFIVLEGADGVGKSSLAAALAERLRPHADLLVTAEPSQSPWGRTFRSSIETGAVRPASSAARALIRQDRAAHVAHEIAPALAAGRWVLCDRYRASTVAYQSPPGEIDTALVTAHARFPRPDLTLLVICDAVLAASRRKQRGLPSRFDDARRQAFVPAALEAALAAFGDPFVTIDTTALSAAAASAMALELILGRGLVT